MRGVAWGAFWTTLQTTIGVFAAWIQDKRVSPEAVLASLVIATLGTVVFVIATHLPFAKRAEEKASGTVLSGNFAGGNQLIQRLIGLIAVNVNVHPTAHGEQPPPKPVERRVVPRGRRVADQPSPIPPPPRLTPLNRIQFVRVNNDVPLFEADGKPMYRLTQVWFRNADDKPISSLSAEVVVTDGYDRFYRKDYAPWAVGTLPENVGTWSGVEQTIDLAPGELAKLNVFRRYEGTYSECYLFSDGESRDRDGSVFANDLDVAITLRALNVDRTFRFDLLNDSSRFALMAKQV